MALGMPTRASWWAIVRAMRRCWCAAAHRSSLAACAAIFWSGWAARRLSSYRSLRIEWAAWLSVMSVRACFPLRIEESVDRLLCKARPKRRSYSTGRSPRFLRCWRRFRVRLWRLRHFCLCFVLASGSCSSQRAGGPFLCPSGAQPKRRVVLVERLALGLLCWRRFRVWRCKKRFALARSRWSWSAFRWSASALGPALAERACGSPFFFVSACGRGNVHARPL